MKTRKDVLMFVIFVLFLFSLIDYVADVYGAEIARVMASMGFW